MLPLSWEPPLPATASLSGSPSLVSRFSSHGTAKYSVGSHVFSGASAFEACCSGIRLLAALREPDAVGFVHAKYS